MIFATTFSRLTGFPPAADAAVLELMSAVHTVIVFGLIGWFAGAIGGWLVRYSRRLDQATGLLFVGLGLRLALESRP
ncbi:MAG: hypothetical protein ACK4N6_07765 [Rhodocyclaceae bacterium]